ncbi:unnamed protein product [Nyctereutes procyonoides]|uniref:(raccoon dog) hypothetical protein n=1 Tax=Nyctereutes procyonoides TaxID=34880 RepID=A0A811YF35_NYCPR|nr:unnamed protein product [Nyctereutes procyonoides]
MLRGSDENIYKKFLPNVGFDPGSPGSRPGRKAGAKLLKKHREILRAASINKVSTLLISLKFCFVLEINITSSFHQIDTVTLSKDTHLSEHHCKIFPQLSHREREREAETQAEGEAGSMHREPDVGFDPGSPGSRPGPKAGAKPLRHPGIPPFFF